MAERVTITERRIDALQPGEILWDTQPLGFGIRCQRRDKVFFVKFRANGRQRWLTLGKHGPLTLKRARDNAMLALGVKIDGKDPALIAQEAKRAETMDELCDQYIEAAPTMPARHGRVKNANSLAVETGRIERHIRPLLGKYRVKEITRAHIEKFQEQVAAGKTKADVKTKKRGRAIVTGGQGTAARTLNLVAALFRYAITLGLRDDNPCHGVTKYGWHSARTFLNPGQMKALGKEIDAQAEKHPLAMAAIRLLALTGARRGEIANLKWSHVDLHHGVLRLPTSKTGERLIILGKPAIKILKKLPRSKTSGFVFPGDKEDSAYQGLPKLWVTIRKEAKLTVRMHDLRHHFASLASELGYQLPTISALLGHRLSGTTGGYIHFTDAALKSAADKIAMAIEERFKRNRSTGNRRR